MLKCSNLNLSQIITTTCWTQVSQSKLIRFPAESDRSLESTIQAISSHSGSRSRICHLCSLADSLWLPSKLRRLESTRLQPTCCSARIESLWTSLPLAYRWWVSLMSPFTRGKSTTMSSPWCPNSSLMEYHQRNSRTSKADSSPITSLRLSITKSRHPKTLTTMPKEEEPLVGSVIPKWLEREEETMTTAPMTTMMLREGTQWGTIPRMTKTTMAV